MQRLLMDDLIKWKDNPDRKPLLLQGVKYCGKTQLLKDFGTKFFKNICYIDFSTDRNVIDLFGQHNNPLLVIKNLSIYFEKDIIPGETLIIFDELHLCPDAFETFASFYDTAQQYYIIAADSFLEVSLPRGFSIPVNKIVVLTLYPMNFYEFLLAQSPMLAMHLKESGFSGGAYKTFQKQLEDKFRDFQIVGGMPEVVQAWIDTKSIETVNKLQMQILRSMESDFSSFCPITMLPKLSAVFNAVPAQLTKGNPKFMFSKVNKKWRAKDLDDAIYWLTRTGLVYKVEHIEKPELPVSGYINAQYFKLYMCDTGLLRCAGQIPSSMILGHEGSYSEIRAAIAENIVCCELVRTFGSNLYYWSAENPAKSEVDFIVQDGNLLIPVEVKAGNAGRARSLLQYRLKYNPKKSVLTGMDNDKDDILPLYAFWNLKEWLNRKPAEK